MAVVAVVVVFAAEEKWRIRTGAAAAAAELVPQRMANCRPVLTVAVVAAAEQCGLLDGHSCVADAKTRHQTDAP